MYTNYRHNITPAFTASRRTAMSQPNQLIAAPRNPLKPIVAAALMGVLASPHAFAFNSGSTGADGALTTTVGTLEVQVPESGVLNYTSVDIAAGTTLKFKKNRLNTPVYILVSGNATIAGTIDIGGGHGAHTGTAGDGNVANDGNPGLGGPGGFDGGRGGRDDQANRPEIMRGGSGLGPGGGKGGIEGPAGCADGRYHRAIGGAAGYATDGREHSAFTTCGYRPPAAVGRAYGSAILQPLIGGSGGGGGVGGLNFAGTGGGGGGGALLLAVSGTLQLTGLIYADGGGAGLNGGTNSGAAGAGGSGGAVRLVASTVTGNGNVRAIGGCINLAGTGHAETNTSYQAVYYTASNFDNIYGPHFYVCPHYGASMGRIRIEADVNTFGGKAYPAYTADTPGPVFLASVPALRIASVAGTAVPTNPTGNADVALPADVTNPVTVALETTNVPPGNTVVVKLIPAYGNPTEVLSPAIAGTAAAGTTSVQLNLPQGPSVLQATTTYTVVVAMGEALSRFAQNERVEKVQLIATMGQQGQAKLITISGKEYMVPMSVLQMVGFSG